MSIESFPRSEIGQARIDEDTSGFEKSTKITKDIIDSIAKRQNNKALEAKSKGEYVEWEKLSFDEKEVRLDLATDLLSGAHTIVEISKRWYTFKSKFMEGAYKGDYEEIQKDVLAIAGIARLIQEVGMRVFYADPIYDNDNCLWVDPDQPKTKQMHDRIWKIKIQLVPNILIDPKQSIAVEKEKLEKLEFGEDEQRFFSVREVKFLLGYQNLSALNESGQWINQDAKNLYLNSFERKLGGWQR